MSSTTRHKPSRRAEVEEEEIKARDEARRQKAIEEAARSSLRYVCTGTEPVLNIYDAIQKSWIYVQLNLPPKDLGWKRDAYFNCISDYLANTNGDSTAEKDLSRKSLRPTQFIVFK